MAALNMPSAGLLLLLLFISILTPSQQQTPPSSLVPPDTACNNTPYPYFCRTILPGHAPANLYDYGRFSLARSLSDARRFSATIDHYLAKRSSLSQAAARALDDCQLLSGLNVDFLVTAGATLNSTTALLDPQADKVEALLSALLTNQQTCFDGLQATASAWSIKNGLSAPISDGNKLYSVSLALFSRAWKPGKKHGQMQQHGAFTHARIPRVPKAKRVKKGRGLLFHEVEFFDTITTTSQGNLPPVSMSESDRKLFESKSGRRLLQSADQQIAVSGIVVVSQDGTGNFTTITDAVNSAPNNTNASNGYYVVYITAGVYEEYVVVPKNKKYVMMIGDGINQTVITGNRSVVDGWTTFNSATVAVLGQGFVATNITIRNTAGAIKHQAVALRSGADLSSFYTCSFEGYQDTLYTHSLRQFYRECDIYGTVDYIFGNAAVVFQNCNIYSRLPMQGQSNTITAQGRTDPNQNTGTSIHNCKFLAAADLAQGGGSTRTYLGRPWKLYSRTVVMQSFMDGSIDPAGWLPWDGTFALDTLYYAEYSNTGPGSDTSRRVAWPGYRVISGTDAANFTVSSFLMGDSWLPQTGVPYLSGMS